jgi:hypothetical protein
MAARLPIDPLPFQADAEISTHFMPDGEEFEGTKRQFFDKLMALWYPVANEAKAAAEREKEIRAAVVALIYPTSFDTEGTDKFELGGGWVFEVKRRMNDKIDEAALGAVREEIAKLPVDPDSGEMPSIDACIKYKPDFSMSGYKALRDDVRVLLNQALTLTPGTPGVAIIPPKAKAAVKPSDQKAVAK